MMIMRISQHLMLQNIVIVSKCNRNLPVITLLPEYVYSSDDTTTYCYEGKGEKKASFVLVGSNTMTKSSSRFLIYTRRYKSNVLAESQTHLHI